MRDLPCQVFPEGKIAPGTLVANTDTKHYLHLTNNVYRCHMADLLLVNIVNLFQIYPSLYNQE